MTTSGQECKRSYICVLALSCPHQDRSVSGHAYVLAVSCPHQDRNVSGPTYVC